MAKRLTHITVFLLFSAAWLAAQPRYGIEVTPLCWTYNDVDSSINRYVLVSSTASAPRFLFYTDQSEAPVDISAGGTLAMGWCGCCDGGAGDGGPDGDWAFIDPTDSLQTIYYPIYRWNTVSIGTNESTHGLRVDSTFQFNVDSTAGGILSTFDWQDGTILTGLANKGLLWQAPGQLGGGSTPVGDNNFTIANNESTLVDRETLGRIGFAGRYSGLTGLFHGAMIEALAEGGWTETNRGTSLNFFAIDPSENFQRNIFTMEGGGRFEMDRYTNFNSDGYPLALLGYQSSNFPSSKDATKHNITGTPGNGSFLTWDTDTQGFIWKDSTAYISDENGIFSASNNNDTVRVSNSVIASGQSWLIGNDQGDGWDPEQVGGDNGVRITDNSFEGNFSDNDEYHYFHKAKDFNYQTMSNASDDTYHIKYEDTRQSSTAVGNIGTGNGYNVTDESVVPPGDTTNGWWAALVRDETPGSNEDSHGIFLGRLPVATNQTFKTDTPSNLENAFRLRQHLPASPAADQRHFDWIRVRMEENDTSGHHIKLYNQKYALPNDTPSTVLGEKTVPVWEGDGAGGSNPIGFLPYVDPSADISAIYDSIAAAPSGSGTTNRLTLWTSPLTLGDAPVENNNGGLRLIPLASAPGSPSIGSIYANSANNRLWYHNGTSYANVVTGTAANGSIPMFNSDTYSITASPWKMVGNQLTQGSSTDWGYSLYDERVINNASGNYSLGTYYNFTGARGSSFLYGVNSYVFSTGGTGGVVGGVSGLAYQDGGSTNEIVGVDGYVFTNGTATSPLLVGIRSEVDKSSAGTATNVIGVDILAQRTAGTATNIYGLRVITSGTAGTKWGVYQSDGGANNAFQGNSRFGSLTAPSYTVDISGSLRLSSISAPTGAQGVIYQNSGSFYGHDGTSFRRFLMEGDNHYLSKTNGFQQVDSLSTTSIAITIATTVATNVSYTQTDSTITLPSGKFLIQYNGYGQVGSDSGGTYTISLTRDGVSQVSSLCLTRISDAYADVGSTADIHKISGHAVVDGGAVLKLTHGVAPDVAKVQLDRITLTIQRLE